MMSSDSPYYWEGDILNICSMLEFIDIHGGLSAEGQHPFHRIATTSLEIPGLLHAGSVQVGRTIFGQV